MEDFSFDQQNDQVLGGFFLIRPIRKVYSSLLQEFPAQQERLYLFQFPTPFPVFESSENLPIVVDDMQDVMPDLKQPPSEKALGKKVAFAADTKPGSEMSDLSAAPTGNPASTATEQKKGEKPEVDGIIGRLEIYQSGAVRMRLGNGILYDVSQLPIPNHNPRVVPDTSMRWDLIILGSCSYTAFILAACRSS